MPKTGAPAAAPPAPAPVTDLQIAEALDNLLRETGSFTSLNGVVEQLQSRLGVELGHKTDLIRTQIHHYILRQFQPPIIVHHQTQNDQFAPHQTPNLRPDPSPHLNPNSNPRPPLQPPTPPPPIPVTVESPSATSAKESAPPVKKRRGGPGGLNKLCGVSPELQTIVGQPKLTRTEIVKQLWAYIRKHNLQDPNNKRNIICNDELRLVFETDCTDMFKMNKLVAKHIIPLEPTKQTGQNAKKAKVDWESGSKSGDPVPIVIISEALASFFGTDEREMSQVEVLRQMGEYIQVNQLQNFPNSTAIRCDAKLQELLGCEIISVLGIPQILARHHLLKKS